MPNDCKDGASVLHPQISVSIFSTIFQITAFCLCLTTISFAIIHDDVQILSPSQITEDPSVYNIRFLGLKLMDWLSIGTVIFLSLNLLLLGKIEDTPFHRYILTILIIYLIAGIIGFIYGIFYNYPWERWYQDLQHTLYMVGFFFITFYLLKTPNWWMFFFVVLISILAIKNIIILNRLFSGVGTTWALFGMRTTQSSDAAIFPLLFCISLPIIHQRKIIWWVRSALALVIIIYLFNSLISFGRTIWVVLPLVGLYLFLELDKSARKRFALYALIGLGLSLCLVILMFPRFFDLAVWKVSTIFDWSLSGDRSNATRTLEILNIGYRLLDNYSLFHGMGLGAWWDDGAFPLLPDAGSGFIGKSRFYYAHLWIIEQLLKIGLIGVIIYWLMLTKFFLRARTRYRQLPAEHPWRIYLLGLNAGFMALMLTSTDFVKVFLIVGVVLGMIARGVYFLENQPLR